MDIFFFSSFLYHSVLFRGNLHCCYPAIHYDNNDYYYYIQLKYGYLFTTASNNNKITIFVIVDNDTVLVSL